MKVRHLALITTFALTASAFAPNAFAQGPGAGARPAFQRGGRPLPPPVVQRDRDRDPRERDLYDRYSGRDSSWQFAFRDGYEAGLRDGRDRRRFDPTLDRRFRNGDRGYSRGWGPRPQYISRYRVAFRDGYERGYYDSANRRGSFSLFFRWFGR